MLGLEGMTAGGRTEHVVFVSDTLYCTNKAYLHLFTFLDN